MANPQPDQFTRIANELMEVMAKFKFNGTQFRILLVVLRYTYGFQRKSHDLSLTFIANSTGTHRQQVKKELDTLIQSKVLIEESAPSFNRTRVIQFNKDYEEWTIGRQSVNPLTVSESTDIQSVNPLTQPVSEFAYQERKLKENIKESSRSDLPPQLNDLNLKRISKAYQENGFGMIYPKAGQDLLDLADNYTIEWVELAMEKAGKLGKRNTGYVEGILKGWKSDGQPNMDGKQKDKDDHIKLIR